METLDRLLELKTKYDKAYYEGIALVSDEEYDVLLDKIEILGGKIEKPGVKSKRNKVKHLNKMLSLNKVISYVDVVNFFTCIFDNPTFLTMNNNTDVIVTPKYDGIAIELIYKKRKKNVFELEDIITRGDGNYGVSVLDKLKDNNRLVKVIDFAILEEYKIKFTTDKEMISFFAELIPSKKVFKKYKEKNPKVKHSRNTTASLTVTKLKDNLTTNDKEFINNLSFKVHTSKDLGLFRYEFELNLIYALGFDMVDYQKYTIEDVYDRSDVNFEIRDYLIDGYVFRIDDSQYSLILGETDRYPKYAIAYKPFSKSSTAVIKDIRYNFNTKGELIPIIEIKPIELDGSTIKNISLSNVSKLYRLNLKPNDRIIVERKGGAVPVIKDVLFSDRDKIDLIKSCPKCNVKLLNKDNRLFCPNFKEH